MQQLLSCLPRQTRCTDARFRQIESIALVTTSSCRLRQTTAAGQKLQFSGLLSKPPVAWQKHRLCRISMVLKAGHAAMHAMGRKLMQVSCDYAMK